MKEKKKEDLDVLVTIGGVPIYAREDGSYVHFMSDLDVCNDGAGSAHGDEYHQAQTAYCSGGSTGSQYMNADHDPYVVVPPQIRAKVPPTVMGCRARVTNMKTGVVEEGVVGDIGPDEKTGETAYCLAKKLNPSITYNSGDTNKIYLYELWRKRLRKQYKLQPA